MTSPLSGPEQYLSKQYFEIVDKLQADLAYRFQYPGVKIYRDIEKILLKSAKGLVEVVHLEVA